jgi:hypothetical protein
LRLRTSSQKLYLDIIDRALANEGILHVRYSDDIRLFVTDGPTGERALVYLARLLRRRGLVLQSAKSLIEEPQEARVRAKGHAPILKAVQRQWIKDMLDFIGIDDDPYPSLAEIDDILAENPDDASLEVIRRAFRQYFLARERPPFDKSLFRYLLKRLGIARDRLAIRRVTWFLTHHAEETSEVWRILSDSTLLPKRSAHWRGFSVTAGQRVSASGLPDLQMGRPSEAGEAAASAPCRTITRS